MLWPRIASFSNPLDFFISQEAAAAAAASCLLGSSCSSCFRNITDCYIYDTLSFFLKNSTVPKLGHNHGTMHHIVAISDMTKCWGEK